MKQTTMTVKEELIGLLNLLSGDLSYDSVAQAKAKLKDLIQNNKIGMMWFSPIHTPQFWDMSVHELQKGIKRVNDIRVRVEQDEIKNNPTYQGSAAVYSMKQPLRPKSYAMSELVGFSDEQLVRYYKGETV